MLPDCVAYLRPKQLIKLSSDLFVYFFECDNCYHHQVLTSTQQLYLLNLYHSSYAIFSVHIISILVCYSTQHLYLQLFLSRLLQSMHSSLRFLA
jgi:hypothetical protein